MEIIENSKYAVFRTKRFEKNVKQIERRNYNMKLLDNVITLLAKGEK
jgi:mRNA-degrading endonuclease YafQ of YafQ-DinJ toxin-antitoxin module